MSFLTIKKDGRALECFNLDNVLRAERRMGEYTTEKNPPAKTIVYFINGSSRDVEIDFDRFLSYLKQIKKAEEIDLNKYKSKENKNEQGEEFQSDT